MVHDRYPIESWRHPRRGAPQDLAHDAVDLHEGS